MTTAKTNTVALISVTGLLGAALFKVLSALHTEEKLKLIVVHRAASKLPAFPKGLEARTLDVNEPTKEAVHAAFADADIVINASGRTSPSADLVLLDHIATLPSLKRYFPSEFSLNYTAAENASTQSHLIQGKVALEARSRTLNIPITLIRNGIFEAYLAYAPFTGLDVPNATLELYSGSAERKIPVTSVPYIAKAVGELVLKDPASLADSYTIVEYSASGDEIAKAIEEETGRKVEIREFSEAQVEKGRKSGDPDALSAEVRVKWGKGEWPAEGAYNPAGQRKTLALTIKDAVAAAK